MSGLAKWQIVVWGVAFSLLILNTAIGIFNIDVLIENDRAISHSRDISRVLADLMSSLKDVETGQRGYLVSNRKDYLEPFYEGEKSAPANLNHLAELTAGDVYYRDRVEALRQVISARVTTLRRIIETQNERGPDAARAEIGRGEGKRLMDEVRELVGEMQRHEEDTLEERSETARHGYRSATLTAIVGGVLTIVMVAMALLLVRFEFNRRQRAEISARHAADVLAVERAQQADSLAEKIKTRTAELEAAIAALRDEISVRIEAESRAAAVSAELTRSNEELEKFAYVASHDLQEPLRKIQAFGDRLVKKFQTTLGQDGVEYLTRMQSAATRMRTLIDDLLKFSRVTLSGQPFIHVDLNLVVAEVVDDLADRIENTGARVDVGSLPQINADPLQMRQLFQNLIGNALKFCKKETAPVVTIRAVEWSKLSSDAKPHEGAVDGHRITIADNCIGFDQQFAERIFELFQRLHNRNEYYGTGIGLAICRKIVERHHGTITAQGKEGEGATFTIDLPETVRLDPLTSASLPMPA